MSNDIGYELVKALLCSSKLKIKKLEWVIDTTTLVEQAKTSFGIYYFNNFYNEGNFRYAIGFHNHIVTNTFDKPKDAKKADQADFEKRIQKSLES